MNNQNIQEFITCAEQLNTEGHFYSALALACTAVDACANLKYPTIKGNGKKYKTFLKDKMEIITRYGFPGISAGCIKIKVQNAHKDLHTDGGYVTMDQIIYHIIRCCLLHECTIDDTVTFTDNTQIGDWTETFFIPKDIIYGLIAACKSEIQLML